MIGLIESLPAPYAFAVGQRVWIRGGQYADADGAVMEVLSPWLVRIKSNRGVAICPTTLLENRE
jgi:hypothetical protein